MPPAEQSKEEATNELNIAVVDPMLLLTEYNVFVWKNRNQSTC